jgi:hypothetical protein
MTASRWRWARLLRLSTFLRSRRQPRWRCRLRRRRRPRRCRRLRRHLLLAGRRHLARRCVAWREDLAERIAQRMPIPDSACLLAVCIAQPSSAEPAAAERVAQAATKQAAAAQTGDAR